MELIFLGELINILIKLDIMKDSLFALSFLIKRSKFVVNRFMSANEVLRHLTVFAYPILNLLVLKHSFRKAALHNPSLSHDSLLLNNPPRFFQLSATPLLTSESLSLINVLGFKLMVQFH